jgi:hypothetical protein
MNARPLLVALLWLLLSAGSAGAQGVRGVVLDMDTGLPIEGATVSLLDFGEEALHSVITGRAGTFWIRIQNSDRYHLRAERIGYAPVTSPPLDLAAGETSVVELRMGVEAVPLAPLTVKASSSTSFRNRALDDFYARRRLGLAGGAAFYGPAELEQMPAADVVSLLQMAPGVSIHVQYSGSTSLATGTEAGSTPRITMRRGIVECTPDLFVDDVLVSASDINQYVSSHSVRAIEIYNGLAVPSEFRVRPFDSCGVIAIWTSSTIDPISPAEGPAATGDPGDPGERAALWGVALVVLGLLFVR